MRYKIGWIALAATLVAGPGAAQQQSSPDMLQSILRVIRLPGATMEARALGVPENDLLTIFAAARERQVHSGMVTELLESGNDAMREHGPVDNFGAFVQARLDEGLRGTDLAAAIRAEHARSGKGRGNLKAGWDDPRWQRYRDRVHTPPGAGVRRAGDDDGKRGNAPGRSDDKGKAGDKGKSDDRPGQGKGNRGGPR